MMRLGSIAAVILAGLGCVPAIVRAQAPGGVANALLKGFGMDRELWIAVRTDGQPGTGTSADPFNGSDTDKLNALFNRFRVEWGENLTIHFGPGVFYGDRMWDPMSNWKIRGAGMDVTVFKTKPDPEAIRTVGFRSGTVSGDERSVSGFELSDCTFDFNTPNLRKSNRAFYYPDGTFGQGWVHYCHATNPPAWSPDKAYTRGQAVVHAGAEYIMIGWAATAAKQGAAPAPGPSWSVLRPNRADQVPAWKEGQTYGIGEAVGQKGRAYLCLATNTISDPAGNEVRWQKLDPATPDPSIYTHAAFIPTRPPGGRNRVSRVKAVNGNGSKFFDREDFIFGLGGNDSVIEDCIVDQFLGDYATLIVLTPSQHGVVRGCSVRGNGRGGTMAYGGWGCFNAVFENNFCVNCRAASNIDSLANRNVTFRNNVCLNCRDVGLLVNVSAEPHTFPDARIEIDGTTRDLNQKGMDGLFMVNNLVEMADDARYGGIQVQQDGLRNARVFNNVIRTVSGSGKARAIGVYGAGATNVTVGGNTCEPGMYSEVTPSTVCRDNRDFTGQPMKDIQGRPIDNQAP